MLRLRRILERGFSEWHRAHTVWQRPQHDDATCEPVGSTLEPRAHTDGCFLSEGEGTITAGMAQKAADSEERESKRSTVPSLSLCVAHIGTIRYADLADPAVKWRVSMVRRIRGTPHRSWEPWNEDPSLRGQAL